MRADTIAMVCVNSVVLHSCRNDKKQFIHASPTQKPIRDEVMPRFMRLAPSLDSPPPELLSRSYHSITTLSTR